MPFIHTNDAVKLYYEEAGADEFLHQVGQGKWGARDPRARPESIWGPGGKCPN